MAETPKPQAGTWTLTAPDGRTWQADSPLRCVSTESRERVPPAVALERIYAAAQERSLFERAAEALAAYMTAMHVDTTDDRASVIARIRAADELAQPVYAELYAIVKEGEVAASPVQPRKQAESPAMDGKGPQS